MSRDEQALGIGPEPTGATPLDDDDLADLIPPFVATRADLNAVEFENIAKATPAAIDRARRGGPALVLSPAFVADLHRRMFGDVWRWAGSPRRRVTNLGVPPASIPTQLKLALDDAIWWHEHRTFTPDERAARIHCRLVAVHPFPNGNGRCTRLVADLYLTSIDEPMFSWGSRRRLDRDGEVRTAYIDALRAADRDEYDALVAFARS